MNNNSYYLPIDSKALRYDMDKHRFEEKVPAHYRSSDNNDDHHGGFVQAGGSSYGKKNKYIDLKINGRLFPTWVMHNFKKYKMPEFVVSNDDPCNSTKNIKQGLREYQAFLSHFLNFNSPYRDILIYHGLGSGKTRSAINIYNVLYNSDPGWNVFILLKATLRDTQWYPELDKWLEKSDKKFRMENIKFISYDSPTADKDFLTKVQNSDSSKKSLYIVEECHNFIKNVYSNISSQKGRRAQNIYDHIIQDKKENNGVRVVCISGTPAVNNPFELALLFNMLRPDTFPQNEAEFNQFYISNTSSYSRLADDKKNIFQRRILGLTSYYLGATPDFFPSKTIHYSDIIMDPYQEDIYSYFEEKEAEMFRRSKQRNTSESTYMSYTRQSCNFAFPLMAQGMSGESRPRPNQFKIATADAKDMEKGKKSSLEKDKEGKAYNSMQNYIHAMEKFINKFDDYLRIKNEEDIKIGYTLKDDLQKLKKIEFNEYVKSKQKKSKVFDAMYASSGKMLAVVAKLLQSPGPVLVYTVWVRMEGLEVFKIYLKYAGFSSYQGMDSGDDYFRYIEYHGGIDKKDRRENVNIYNKPQNKDGKVCKIIMITAAGAEGLNLFNTRQVHIMEPHWQEVQIEQMIGRAIRHCSHKALPMDQRHVDVYRYKSVRNPKLKKRMTADQIVEGLARSKGGLIGSFLDAVKESAIDCKLFMNYNKLSQEYKCFQFDETSLFDPQIGPAFKGDMYDDLRLNNGSNNTRSETVRIKVLKIVAVQQTTSGDDGNIKYSKSENYWYNPDTNVVYDYDLHYALGKVGTDDDGLPLKLDSKTYIITKTIPIPRIDD